jgi:hypothetical protein
MNRGLFLTAVPLLAATLAGAQEMATIATRPGVTQSFLIEGMHGRKPEALALLYVGGGGNIRLRMEDGRVKFAERNFLPRSRGEFIRNGILPVEPAAARSRRLISAAPWVARRPAWC